MKMQSLAVIFAIIIIPITIVVSIYINTQVDTLTLQTSYDTKLNNATYDAVKAFQLNETNSNTQNVATEKIRDIEASVQTFYNSLAMSLNLGAFGEEQLSPYIPALVYTLYDGYYIYAPFNNINAKNSITGATEPKYENGVKPYVYYSARYHKGNIDITVNYTLDNYVTIYGYNSSGTYVTRSGYLINPSDVTNITSSSLMYKGIKIENETLKEINSETYASKNYVTYVYKDTENNQREKIYYDGSKWYRISLDKKRIDLKPADYPSSQDNSAYLYYKEAAEFSNWVKTNFGTITLNDAVGEKSNQNQDKNIYYISTEKLNDKIFNLDSNNDPENEESVFNDHRRGVIKYVIQTNLTAAIAGYNTISQVNDTTYNFKMPILTEEDWDKVLNNVSVISFMQGFPIKNKYYNGYSIVTNNKNREFIDSDFIYFSSDGSSQYHSVYDSSALSVLTNIVGYRNLDFNRKKVSNSDNTTQYYYPQWKDSCYNCVVTSSVRNTEKTFFEYMKELTNGTAEQKNIAKAYYTAIGRERYNSYKSNKLY